MPNVCAPVQLGAPGREQTTKGDLKSLKRAISHLQDTEEMGVRYVALDLATSRLVLFTDASFSNVKYLKSQLRFVILMADESNNANLLHYALSLCR